MTRLSYNSAIVSGVSAGNNCWNEHLKFTMGELVATERANRHLFYANSERFITQRAQMRGRLVASARGR